MRNKAKCHPERLNKAYGLCDLCYKKELYKRNPESAKRRAKEYRLRDIDKYKRLSRRRHIQKTYGLTPEDYDAMLNRQHGRCLICQVKYKRNMHVDHCHKTGKIRGLLCGPCNGRLGWYELYNAKIGEYLNACNDE